GLRMAQESVGLISVAPQAFVSIAGCGVNALSGLRMAQASVGLISVAHQAFATTAGCGFRIQRINNVLGMLGDLTQGFR
ncbi:hypothetical protein O5269_28415, partial [Escherichia coli]|nr:hypothetical protein [Escherichia coli]